MAALLTVDDAKLFLGIDAADTRSDAQITALLPAAQDAVVSYTQRDFDSAQITETRTFEYDGSGYVDIDDATAVSAVEFVVPNSTNISIPSDLWTAQPYHGPIFYYVQIGAAYSGINPTMGFERNLDVIYAEGRLAVATSVVAVTATWGWSTVPLAVQLAIAWTVGDWKDKASNEGLTSESIETFSRSWAGRANNSQPAQAIPNRARDLLAQYQRFDV